MSLAKMRFQDHMDDIFDAITELTPLQRHTIKERYRFMMAEYRARCRLYTALFYIFRTTVTVGSLGVPALLSIQNTPGGIVAVYWFTWALSLAVTTANGIQILFKLDKHFYTLHATAERLRSEAWQYVELSGRYSGHHGHPHKPTHSNQFVYFCSQLEKINMKRVDDEYNKTGEDTHVPITTTAQKNTGAPLVPSPPDPSTQTPGDQGQGKSLGQSPSQSPSQSQSQGPDSITIVEDYDDATGVYKKKGSLARTATVVQMSGMPEETVTVEPVLPAPSEHVPGEPPILVGTEIRP